ncbi:enoyl-CoA hydratase/carnithine racemase [Paraburkholderia sp. GAS199]|uniref:enoyl-CoA hydratase/isomerase family protein n=1 Tax=Paraburkholderia sp. GAS199 TaxID=3035126 RepID=UPI003D1A13CE
MSNLRVRIEKSVGHITLASPPQNRLSIDMASEMESALESLQSTQVRALLLDAEGEDFSFGVDIVPWPEMSTARLRFVFQRWMDILNAIETLPFPTIAAVQGTCFGGGLELASRCDVIIAADNARFGHPEQSLGIVTLLGGIYRVAERAGRSTAAMMAFTSDPMSAEHMLQRGFVNEVVPLAGLLQTTEDLAARFASGPTRAHAVHKALLRAWGSGGVCAADAVIFDLAMALFDTEDARDGVRSAVSAYKAGRPRPAMRFKGK